MNDWIQTYTGRKFYPLHPRPQDVSIIDIAFQLGNRCRFSGACRFYSVAQHSVLVSRRAEQWGWMHALLHDAAEAYLPDIPRPIKGKFRVGTKASSRGFDEVERRVLIAIYEALNLTLPYSEDEEEVKKLDLQACITEKRDLVAREPEPWTLKVEPWDDVFIHPQSPTEAAESFLERYKEIKDE